MNKKQINELSFKLIGICIAIHKELGPGLLESVYHECLKYELECHKLNFQTELTIPIIYKEKKLYSNLRCDLVIEYNIVMELKSVKEFNPIHEAKLLIYMNLLKKPKGILVNFSCKNIFHQGQKTYVNDLFRKLPD